MNAERLHAIVRAVRNDLATTASVQTLQSLRDALQNQVNQPQQANFQQQVSSLRTSLLSSLDSAPSNSFSPTWREAISELGLADLLGSRLGERIDEIFSRNQITPSVAHREIQALFDQLTLAGQMLERIELGFSHFKISAEELNPGECEVGVLVPRAAVKNNLKALGLEFAELSEILGVFSEIGSGERPDLEVREISSSDFNVFLESSVKVAACIAVAVERIVALYKQLLEIKKLRGDLKNQGVSEGNLKGVEEHANSLMSKGIETAAKEIVLNFYEGKELTRRNELEIELKRSMNKIANRIDRGFNVSVRIEPPPPTEADAPKTVEYVASIRSAERSLQFLKTDGPPVLSLPEVAEEEHKRSRKPPTL